MEQLILVIETNNQVMTDRAYIDKTIKYYFDISSVKLQYVTMDGKYNFNNSKVVCEINSYISMNTKEQNHIIYFFDIDSTGKKNNDFMCRVKKYCSKNNYDIVLFNRTIEEVFIGRKVRSNEKLPCAKKFSQEINPGKFENYLNKKKPLIKESNFLLVMNKYLTKK